MASTPTGHRRKSTARRAGKFALVLVILAGAGIGLASLAGNDKKSAKAQATGVDRAVVNVMDFDVTTTASGAIEARNEIVMRNPLERQSTIVELLPEGTRVKAGDVVVVLNTDELERDADQESLQVETARAELVKAENEFNIQRNENESKLRQAQLKVDLAELALLKWLRGDHEQKLNEIRVAIDKSKRDMDRLEEKVKRAVELEKEGFLSKDELERDQITLLEARAAYEKALLEEVTYNNFEVPKEDRTKSSDLHEAQAELERVEMNNAIELAIKEAARDNQRQQLSLREANLAQLRKQIDAATVRAPVEGMVVYATSIERFGRWDDRLQIGQQVYPNKELVVIPDVTSMIASVKVHESLAGKIAEGQAALVKVPAAGAQPITGKVESKSVMADKGGWWDDVKQYGIRIALELEPGSGLKPGDNCEAVITMGRVTDALAVPVQAIFTDGPVRFVYSSAGSGLRRVPVQLGERSDTFAQITAGLKQGQSVLLRTPSPGEVVQEAWDPDALKLAGYDIDDKGNPVARGGPPGRRGGGRPGGAQPVAANQAPSEKAPAAQEAAAKPAETEKPALAADSKEEKTQQPAPAEADSATKTEAKPSDASASGQR